MAERDHVLLAFNGPVCTIFGGSLTGHDMADRLRPLVGYALPPDIERTHDPFDILRYATTCGPKTAHVVETQLRRLESEAVASAPETPGTADTLRELHQAGCTLTIVSNNSAEAIRSFLIIHDLATYIRRISARTSADPNAVMPSPHLVEQAISALGTSPQFCAMVTKAPEEKQAAKAAGVTVIESLNQLGPQRH